jgi:hypothetical protein
MPPLYLPMSMLREAGLRIGHDPLPFLMHNV